MRRLRSPREPTAGSFRGRAGRGEQLRYGALQAEGRWLLFLHADTRLATGWEDAASDFVKRTGQQHRAAVFTFKLDDQTKSARLLECHRRRASKGAAIPLRRSGPAAVAGPLRRSRALRSMPLMEDVDLVRHRACEPGNACGFGGHERSINPKGWLCASNDAQCCMSFSLFHRCAAKIDSKILNQGSRLPTLFVMVKAPVAGGAKTRLASAIGTGEALRFYRSVTASLLRRVGSDPRWRTVLAVSRTDIYRRGFGP